MANQSNAFSVQARVESTSNLAVGTVNVAGNTNAGPIAYLSETVTTTANASITIPVTLVSSAGGAYTLSLPNGTTVGQQKQFIYTVVGGDVAITPATTCGAYTAVTFVAVGGIGQCITLVWTAQGWAVVSRASGSATQVTTAVVGYPTT